MGEIKLPTLFGDCQMKTQLAVLCLVCGSNIEEGFGLSYRYFKYKQNQIPKN